MNGFKIIYEGVDIYPEISVNACFHDMYCEKQSDELLLRLNDTRRLWGIWSPKKNDIICVEYATARTGKMFVDSVIPENGLITLRAYAMPQTAKDITNKSWEKVRFVQLAKEVAGRHGLNFAQYGIEDKIYDYAAQHNQPDFAFLQQRCTLEGAAFLVYDGTLVLYDEAYMESQPPAETVAVSADTDFEYRDDAVNAYARAEITNSGYTGVYATGNGSEKLLRRVIPVQMGSQAEANRFARGLLRNANKNMAAGVVYLGLMPDYAAASVIGFETNGAQSWDGPAFISRLRHDYVRETSKVFFRKPLEGY